MMESPVKSSTYLLLPLALAACATQAAPPAAAQAPPPAAVTQAKAANAAPPTPVAPVPPQLRDMTIPRAEFARETGAKYGIDPAYIESVLAKATIRDGIIAAMSRPAEAKPWRDYRGIFINQARIDGGRAFLAKHRDTLAKVEAQYGVPAEVIVAIIGVETS